MVEGGIDNFSFSPSDLDIGVKPDRKLTVQEKVEISVLFEDLFDAPRVDLIVLPEASTRWIIPICWDRPAFLRNRNG